MRKTSVVSTDSLRHPIPSIRCRGRQFEERSKRQGLSCPDGPSVALEAAEANSGGEQGLHGSQNVRHVVTKAEARPPTGGRVKQSVLNAGWLIQAPLEVEVVDGFN